LNNLRQKDTKVIIQNSVRGPSRELRVLFGCNIYYAFDRFKTEGSKEKYKRCIAQLFKNITAAPYWASFYELVKGKQ